MLLTKTLAVAGATALLIGSSQAKALDIDQIQMPKSGFDGVHTNRWDDAWRHQTSTPQPQLASIASWYGVPDGFHGRRTASGEIFNAYGLSAAHRTLPLGTRIRVTNTANNRSVVVRVNDRGPFHGNRVLDLSQGAAARLGMISSGTARVRIQVLGK
jgi:rare lipoprotein A (peptidoglycan hydrolase)